ncbi:MAG: GGDEF domain-containing protein [Deltaproteobacteria bacterium]|nr:GGDEF domain-containing protein [Deltaproteobacteria bacterium]
MSKDFNKELKQLKRDYFDLEEIRREEKDSLLKVINTVGLVAAMQKDMAPEITELKEMISQDKEIPFDDIDQYIRRIKDKILIRESGAKPDDEAFDPLAEIQERLVESCRAIRKIMAILLDEFYPMNSEMTEAAEKIQVDCKGDPARIEIKEPIERFLDFIEGLKIKIADDFRYVNKAFLSLLAQIKEVEATLANEFGGEAPLKEIEYFEMKIDSEMDSIANSFNLYATINEVKKAVISKLVNIRNIVSIKKKEELRKTQIAQENINSLKKKIIKVEQDARKISKRAKRLQEAALTDNLTGLYNRRALDKRLKGALDTFRENGLSFSIILFDVDKFKSINDTLGHLAGDKVLQKVAECLTETFRKDDFIARWGGDEFVVLIEELTKELAAEKILAFRKNLKRRKFVSYKEGEIDLTVSAGIALAMEGDTLDSLMERADEAMYAMKQERQDKS